MRPLDVPQRRPGWGDGLAAPDAELMDRLLCLVARLQEEKRQAWQRSVPIGDLLSDRAENARRLGFGKGATAYDSTLVLGDVSVGEETWVGPWTVLDGSGGPLRIGHHVAVSAGVHVYTHDTVDWCVSGGKAPYRNGAVSIGDRTFVGPQSVVARGVTIGAGSVVGANSFVQESCPPGSFLVGTPARVRGRVVLDGDRVRIDPVCEA